MKFREGVDTEIEPFTKIGILKVAELQILLRVQSSFIAEGGDGGIIKAGPGIFPSVKVGHPVRNVDVDTVNARCGDLPHMLHIDFSPVHGVGANPYVFVARTDPERRARGEHSGIARKVALQPFRMIFHDGVSGGVGVRSNAFGARNVDKSMILGCMGRIGNSPNGFQFCGWVEKAFVASRDVVIDFDAKNVTLLRITNNCLGVVCVQAVCPNADIVCPVLFLRECKRRRPGKDTEKQTETSPNTILHLFVPRTRTGYQTEYAVVSSACRSPVRMRNRQTPYSESRTAVCW